MRMIWYECKMDVLRTFRYKMGLVSDLVIYTLLLCFFFWSNTGQSFQAQYGIDNYQALLLFGYIAWTFSVTAISTIASQLLTELQRGTLFFKLHSRLPLQILYLGDLLSSVLVQTIVVIIYSLITFFIFHVHYVITLPIIATFFISVLGMYGIGLMIAGLSLYYKRIGAVVLLVQLFLLFVTDTIPTSSVITGISRVLPLTMCNTVIRNSLLHRELGTTFLLLCVVSLLWFLVGYLMFDRFMNRARKKGNLLLY
nr:ABC transporter permease [uncultured Sellimonas sp.]